MKARPAVLIAAGALVVAAAGGLAWWQFASPRTPAQSLAPGSAASGTGITGANAGNAELVAAGKTIFETQCAACHGANLEGQPNWRTRLPSGRLPAPPHDRNGHTWHHPDDVLFDLVKYGVMPGTDYRSDMPAYDGALSDDQIWAVLSYIKGQWPAGIRSSQERMSKQYRKQLQEQSNDSDNN